MTDAERIARGRRYEDARPTLDELFDALRQKLLNDIENADPKRGDDILEMHRGLQNIAKLRHAVLLVINDGMLAANAASVVRLNRA